MRTRGTAIAVLLVGALALAGCTTTPDEVSPTVPPSSDPTTQAPTPTSSPVPTVTPSAAAFDATVPPSVPGALSGDATSANAQEVAWYFISLFPYIMATGDVEQWDAMSGSDCAYCGNARDVVDDLVAAGESSVGGRITLVESEVKRVDASHFVVSLQYTEEPSRTLDESGTVVEEFPGTSLMQGHFEVSKNAGGWKIDGASIDEYGRS